MYMGLKEVINSPRGLLMIAFMLGFGVSTFFRKECKDGACIDFKAPPLDKIQGQTFAFNSKCYKFESEPGDCNKNHKILEF